MIIGEVLYDINNNSQLLVTVKYATSKVEVAYNYLSPDNADHNALIDASGIHGRDSQIPGFDAEQASVTVLAGYYDAHITAFVMVHVYNKVYRFYVKSQSDVERLINRIKYQGHIPSEIDRIADWLRTNINVHVLTVGHIHD